jgi:hypothetical protein
MAMSSARIVIRRISKVSICVVILLTAGCYAGYFANHAAGGDTEAATGEQHDVPYSAHDAFLLTQDVLRGEGVLFEVQPDDKLVTLWRDADTQAGMLGSIVGKHPQYRYEIAVVPQGSRRSRIIVNVRAEDIADEELSRYTATARLGLFAKVDQLAMKFPPSGGTPNEGGVNYALLPNEDLKALARRATGTADNWQTIAQDNGLKSPSDASGLSSVWIRNSLLTRSKKGTQSSD